MREKLFNWLNFVKIWSTPGEFNVLVSPLSPGSLVTTQALQYLVNRIRCGGATPKSHAKI